MDEKPPKPDEEECCGSGCKPCIFDVYQEKLKKWELEKSNVAESQVLNQFKYSPFLITSIDDVTESVKIFKFQAVGLKREKQKNEIVIKNASPRIDYEILKKFIRIDAGEYLILKGIHELNGEKSVLSRSYTPVSSKADQENGVFTIIVSLRPMGKMSQFLIRLNPNDIVSWRGPYREFEYSRNAYERVLMIGGGTGIVPLYNIAKAIVEDDQDDTLLNVFCSFRSPDRILLRKELNRLKDYWNFKLRIFISGEKEIGDFRSNYNEPIEFGKIDENVISGELTNSEIDKFSAIVSGPDSFNKLVHDCLFKFGIKSENIFVFW